MLFDFLQDAGNYEERKVDRYQEGNLFVSTAAVSDGKQPYETAVAHPEYNRGGMVIVEGYPTRKAAQAGHKKWVATMTTEPLPAVLQDCLNSAIGSLASEVGCGFTFERKRATKKGRKRG